MFRSPVPRTRSALAIGIATLGLAFLGLAIGGTADALVPAQSDHHEHHMRIKLDGAYNRGTHDSTPTLSGRVDTKGEAHDIKISASLSGTSADGTHYSAVPCNGMVIKMRGKWTCSFTTPIKPGHYVVTVKASVTDASGETWSDSATKKIVVLGSPPNPEPSPDPKPTHDPKPSPDPKPPVTPKPTTHDKPETPHQVASPPTAPKTVKTPVEPSELKWKFRVINAQGVDVTGQGLHLGDHVRIIAKGLPAGAKVELVLHSTPTTLGTAVAEADGTLNLPVMVPDVIETGQHRLIATLTAPGCWFSRPSRSRPQSPRRRPGGARSASWSRPSEWRGS